MNSDGLGERIPRVCEGIIGLRDELDYMTVARALLLRERSKGVRRVAEMCECLGVSRQTRHNWFKADLVLWVEFWERRLGLRQAEKKGQKAKVVILDHEWRWMAGILAQKPFRSWEFRRRVIERAAQGDPAFRHLCGISRVTLWRNRSRLLIVVAAKSGEEQPF